MSQRLFLRSRSERGSLGSLMLIMGVLFVMGAGAFAIDIAHCTAIRHQLQNAADAAAFAGAMDLSTSPSSCSSDALAVAQKNTADNWVLSNTSRPVNVSVSVVPQSNTQSGSVTVQMSMLVNHFLPGLFGSSTMSVTAIAGSTGKLTGMYANGSFPLALSGTLLTTARAGTVLNLDINSQKYKNAGFTSLTVKSADANWISNAIAQALGQTAKNPVTIPSVKIGDLVYLNNGTDGQKTLASDPYYSALLNMNTIFLPVVDSTPPMNQNGTVIGFVGVKVTGVSKNQSGGLVESLTVVVMQPASAGISSVSYPSTGNSTLDTSLASVAPSVVKMIH